MALLCDSNYELKLWCSEVVQFCPSHFISLALSDFIGADIRTQNLVVRNCEISTLIFPFSNTHEYAQNEEKEASLCLFTLSFFRWNHVVCKGLPCVLCWLVHELVKFHLVQNSLWVFSFVKKSLLVNFDSVVLVVWRFLLFTVKNFAFY